MNDFYVYQYVRSVESENGDIGSPYYVGKGRGRRWNADHVSVYVPEDRKRIIFIAENLTEIEAFQIEMLLIYLHGRIDIGSGCLRNRSDGGEGNSGLVHSEESKLKMSLSRTGLKRSEETKAKMSEWQKGQKRKPMSEEQKSKISATTKGRHKSEEFKAMISLANRRRVLSQESKDKIASSLKGRKLSEEMKKKLSDLHKKRIAEEGIKGGVKKHSEETRNKMSIAQKERWRERREYNENSYPFA